MPRGHGIYWRRWRIISLLPSGRKSTSFKGQPRANARVVSVPVVDDGDEEDEVADEGDGGEAEVHGPPPRLGQHHLLMLLRELGRGLHAGGDVSLSVDDDAEMEETNTGSQYRFETLRVRTLLGTT